MDLVTTVVSVAAFVVAIIALVVVLQLRRRG
jgi:hypothetical protein